jgi:membrane protein DedA with SNARE-associated domain/rhodanese-related sulfurtransferase
MLPPILVQDVTASFQESILSVVFVNVLLQQLGFPMPAVPTLLVAGSLAATSSGLIQVMAVAMSASLCADVLWYAAGRAFGYRVLIGLCKLSLNPGSCVTTTEGLFLRWGVWSLVVAKFIPGFSIVGPPIAGALKLPFSSFLAASATGACLWAGTAALAGWLWHDQVSWLLQAAVRNGAGALALIAAVVATWLAWVVWQRRRFNRLASIPYLMPAELMREMASDTPPLLLDLRGADQIASSGSIKGAVQAQVNDLQRAVGQLGPDSLIVTLCACPADATAIRAAHMLAKMGFKVVRPMRGGYDALAGHLRKVSMDKPN